MYLNVFITQSYGWCSNVAWGFSLPLTGVYLGTFMLFVSNLIYAITLTDYTITIHRL